MPSTECMSNYFGCFLLECASNELPSCLLLSDNLKFVLCCEFVSKNFWLWDHFITVDLSIHCTLIK